MRLAGETVVVTGAGGFIGSHLAESLVRCGAKVRAVVHYNSRQDLGNLALVEPDVRRAMEVRALDVADPFSVRSVVEDAACVFHLAALIGIPYSYVAPASYVETNVRGTLNVLEAARLCRTPRVVHTSTSEVYGTAVYAPIDENHPLQAQSPYSASKIAADKLAESYARSFELPVSVLRPFNTFGPRQSERAVIPTIIAQLLRGNRPIALGSLDPVRDFTFVSDTARAFVAVAESDATIGLVCNAGHGKGISVGDLASKVAQLLGVNVEIQHEPGRVRPRDSEVGQLICDAGRLRQLTGWIPEVSLQQGLEQVLAYMRNNLRPVGAEAYVI